jgi:hypothetical protein
MRVVDLIFYDPNKKYYLIQHHPNGMSINFLYNPEFDGKLENYHIDCDEEEMKKLGLGYYTLEEINSEGIIIE